MPLLQLLDPFESDYPERIEEELQYGNLHARCCAFNRRGTLLATGCNEGVAVLWDFDTRGVVKVLQVGGGPRAAPGASVRVHLHVCPAPAPTPRARLGQSGGDYGG